MIDRDFNLLTGLLNDKIKALPQWRIGTVNRFRNQQKVEAEEKCIHEVVM